MSLDDHNDSLVEIYKSPQSSPDSFQLQAGRDDLDAALDLFGVSNAGSVSALDDWEECNTSHCNIQHRTPTASNKFHAETPPLDSSPPNDDKLDDSPYDCLYDSSKRIKLFHRHERSFMSVRPQRVLDPHEMEIMQATRKVPDDGHRFNTYREPIGTGNWGATLLSPIESVTIASPSVSSLDSSLSSPRHLLSGSSSADQHVSRACTMPLSALEAHQTTASPDITNDRLLSSTCTAAISSPLAQPASLSCDGQISTEDKLATFRALLDFLHKWVRDDDPFAAGDCATAQNGSEAQLPNTDILHPFVRCSSAPQPTVDTDASHPSSPCNWSPRSSANALSLTATGLTSEESTQSTDESSDDEIWEPALEAPDSPLVKEAVLGRRQDHSPPATTDAAAGHVEHPAPIPRSDSRSTQSPPPQPQPLQSEGHLRAQKFAAYAEYKRESDRLRLKLHEPLTLEDAPVLNCLGQLGEKHSAMFPILLGEAHVYFQQSLSLEPRQAQLWDYLGQRHYAQGDVEKALECFLTSLDTDSRNVNALSHCANIYATRREPRPAYKCLARIIRLQPESEMAVSAFHRIGQLHAFSSPSLIEASTSHLRRALDALEAAVDLLTHLGPVPESSSPSTVPSADVIQQCMSEVEKELLRRRLLEQQVTCPAPHSPSISKSPRTSCMPLECACALSSQPPSTSEAPSLPRVHTSPDQESPRAMRDVGVQTEQRVQAEASSQEDAYEPISHTASGLIGQGIHKLQRLLDASRQDHASAEAARLIDSLAQVREDLAKDTRARQTRAEQMLTALDGTLHELQGLPRRIIATAHLNELRHPSAPLPSSTPAYPLEVVLNQLRRAQLTFRPPLDEATRTS